MKRLIFVSAMFLMMLSCAGSAEEASFSRCKLADAKGKQTDARLVFSDNEKALTISVSDRNVVSIPYENLDKFSYEYTKKHRVTQGAIVMVASLGAGAIVMLTQSKSHWLYVDYREQNVPKTLVLRMDKNEYEKIFDAVKAHTGKDVQFLADAGKGKGKGNGM
jgi:hypothetical protein